VGRGLLVCAVLAGFVARGHAAGARAEDNTPPAGFTALFNGRDLTNWQGLVPLPDRAKLSPAQLRERQEAANEKMRAHWKVVDGALHYDGKGDSLQTARDYGNVELYVDWRIEKGGDSGIYLRGNPQVQIWEASSPSAQKADGSFIGSGGLYNDKHHPHDPLVIADHPAGEWNRFWIRMVGDHVTVKLNDQLVVDDTPLENYWEPDRPLPARGPIELQHHGSHLEFKNIYLKELP
jgi:Domain of Unknown Function (DUF1080)